MRKNTLGDFWRHVAEPDERGCRLWTGLKNVHGYGKFFYEGKYHLAHRLAYEMGVGPIEQGMSICHECDIPACVEHSHLFQGTHKENIADAKRKGRTAKPWLRGIRRDPDRVFHGETHHKARLNPEKVRDIRQRYQGGETQQSLAEEYGVTQASVSALVLGKTWKRV